MRSAGPRVAPSAATARGLFVAALAACALFAGCGARSALLLERSSEAEPAPQPEPEPDPAPDAAPSDPCPASPGGPDVVELAVTEERSCALLRDGTVWCWGRLADAETGLPGDVALRPVRVAAISAARHLSCGSGGRCCAILEGSSVTCFGRQKFLDAAQGVVSELAGATALAIGTRELCALRGDDDAICGGVPVKGTGGATGIALADWQVGYWIGGHVCFLARGGTVACMLMNEVSLQAIDRLQGVTQLASGDSHICAGTGGGARTCWGWNDMDQFGPVGSTSAKIEAQTSMDEPAIEGGGALFFGGRTSCQRTVSGELVCWGANDDGQLGRVVVDDGDPESIVPTPSDPVPARVPGLSCVATAAVGRHHVCAVAKGGVHCWGKNDAGQLGDGTTTSRVEPALVRW